MWLLEKTDFMIDFSVLFFSPSAGDSKGIEDMDMNAVRLCFQCELEWDDGRKDSLSPVLSNPIYDKSKTFSNTHLWLLATVSPNLRKICKCISWLSRVVASFFVLFFSQRPRLHHSWRSAVWTSTEVPVSARRRSTCCVTKCRKVSFISVAQVQNLQTLDRIWLAEKTKRQTFRVRWWWLCDSPCMPLNFI